MAGSGTILGLWRLHALLALAIGLVPSGGRAADWAVVAEAQGVTVEQQSIEGSVMPAFRGTSEIAADLRTLLPVLLDTKRHTDWMPDCREARVIGEQGTLS